MAKHKPHRKKNPKAQPHHKYKKGDKIHGTKKGKKGEAAAYVTRAQALAKLQIPLADFRRLCILKGIYPRDPKKKPSGMDKTYYHHKDITFLMHEPLLNKFFELKTFMKKFKRLMGRNERDLAGKLEGNKPKFLLNHLVRERYPAFEDALRDMDDAVSMLALFSALSADQTRAIPAEAVTEATRIYQEFQLYCIRSQTLRKVFASIKGYYFQAEVRGSLVTWLSPHQFAQELPPEVDFKVMLTFLDFYRAHMKFVNFKLYADKGLAYPPKRKAKLDAGSADVAALEVEMREAKEARDSIVDDEEGDKVADDVAADFGEQSAEALEMQKQVEASKRMKTVFRGLRVFINREVPLRPVYFTLLCGGAQAVGWERGAEVLGSGGPGSAFAAYDEAITHQIVDRPPEQVETRPGREYVQPQWVFDSFNTGVPLPIAPYAPGRAPPPHLSPFVDDKAEGYVPRQREILDRFAAEASGSAAPVESTEGDGVAVSVGPTKSNFEVYTEELKAERSGIAYSEYKDEQQQKAAEGMERAQAGEVNADEDEGEPRDGAPPTKPVPTPTDQEEERMRQKALMPKKHKRLLQRIEKGEATKAEANERLTKKRRKGEKK